MTKPNVNLQKYFLITSVILLLVFQGSIHPTSGYLISGSYPFNKISIVHILFTQSDKPFQTNRASEFQTIIFINYLV